MQTKFLNDLSKASVIVVMTSLFNTVTKSKSRIPNPKIHTWQQLRNITLIRNLIEIVLIQDYSLLYNADQITAIGTYALLCWQGSKHSVINSIPAEYLSPLPISSLAKRHFNTRMLKIINSTLKII